MGVIRVPPCGAVTGTEAVGAIYELGKGLGKRLGSRVRSQMGDWGPGGRPRAQEERKGSPQPGEWAGVTVSALPGLTPASP